MNRIDDEILYELIKRFEIIEFESYECPITSEDHAFMFQDGGIAYNDGILLYTMIKSLKSKHILELGTFIGISGKFIALAIDDFTNQSFVTIDECDDEIMAHLHGKPIGFYLKPYGEDITFVSSSVEDYLKSCPDSSIDFLFDDTDHTYETVLAICKQLPRIITPRGFATFHDSLMEAPQKAFKDAGILDDILFLYPYTGIGIWRNME